MKSVLMLLSKPWENDPRVVYESDVLCKTGRLVHVEYMYRKPGIPETAFRVQIPVWWVLTALSRWNGFDVIHAHDLDTMPAAVAIKLRTGLPLLLDLHDLPTHAKGLLARLIRHADAVVTVTQDLADWLRFRMGCNATIVRNLKPVESPNWTIPPNNGDGDDDLLVGYVGSLTSLYAVEQILETSLDAPDIQFRIAGSGPLAWDVSDHAKHHMNTDFLGQVSLSEVQSVCRSCDLMLCMPDPNNPNTQVGLQNKLFDAMAAGRPVLATECTPTGDFVRENGIGWTMPFPRLRTSMLRTRLLEIKTSPEERRIRGKRALELAKSPRFSWDVESKKLLEVYRRLNL